MSNGLFTAGTYPPNRQMIEETIHMKAIVVTDQAAGTAGMKLEKRPEPQAAINDVVVQVHASGFVPTEAVGGTAGIRPHGLDSRRHAGGVCGRRGAAGAGGSMVTQLAREFGGLRHQHRARRRP